MSDAKPSRIDASVLDRLLGLESSKIGFYADVKQKIQELESANLGLRTKKGELQAVFDAINDGLAIFDGRGNIQHRNQVLPHMFPKETLIGKTCRDLFHPDQNYSPAQCPVERALKGEIAQLFFTKSRNGGAPRHFDATATPIQDPSGQSRALMLIRDITERRNQELQLMQAEKMSSVGILAAGVAHEVNNPLSSITGYSEALLRRFREDPGLAEDPRLEVFQKYLEVVTRESYRCKEIIGQLLSFSRKSDGSFGSVNVNHVIEEVVDLLNNNPACCRVEIRKHLQSDLPPVKGDAAGLRQVFMNLLVNASQAIEGAGKVEISTCETIGPMVIIEVKDTGCGIPTELLDQIWDPFFTTKKVGHGFGLGLAVVYNIVKTHMGEIHVESEVGHGSTFSVRLPICRE